MYVPEQFRKLKILTLKNISDHCFSLKTFLTYWCSNSVSQGTVQTLNYLSCIQLTNTLQLFENHINNYYGWEVNPWHAA